MEAEQAQAMQAFAVARSYLIEVDERIKDLQATVMANAGEEAEGIAGALYAGFMRGRAITRERNSLLRDIDLALAKIRKVEAQASEADLLPQDDGMVGIPELAAMAHCLRGMVLMVSGDLKPALREYEESVRRKPSADAHFQRGIVLVELKRPREACIAWQAASELEPAEGIGLEAAKALQRLESEKVAGKWFVGSWKVQVGLVVLALATVAQLLVKQESRAGVIPAALVVCGATVGYWKWKTR